MAATMNPVAAFEGINKRKRSHSPSPLNDDAPPSTRRRSLSSPSRADIPRVDDVDPVRRAERQRQLAARLAASELSKAGQEKTKEEKEKDKELDVKAEFAKLVGSRSGGVYMPPARLRAMREAASADRSSAEYQRLSWDALRKSITGIVNRVNIANIKFVVPELFGENLIRGRGLFARSVMKAQAASLPFTPVFAALVSIINTKLPQVGELVLARLISQFRRAFKRNDKTVCQSTTNFIAHLVNQGLAHEIIALQILFLLLERPTDDSIEIAVGFTREVGAFLAENSPQANSAVFERFRAVLNESKISNRVQYMIEVLMQVRKDKYKDNPILPEGLDLVEEDEQITHHVGLEEELQVQEGLNIFKFDPDYLENEEKYKSIKAEILGEGSSEEEESGSEESDSDEEDEAVEAKEGIEDRTQTNLVNLRRVIYLTIMNALNYEEAVHKLLKIQIKEGEEIELANMIIECCSQERSYSTFYGLIGERFCKLNRVWNECFEEAFQTYYGTIHRYETNRLRNIARFFGHLLANDAVSWAVLDCIKINEDDTTSSSRIFVKIMMQEVMESMGLPTLKERFADPEVKMFCRNMFPLDNPKNTRFAINYFTSIGLGAVTEEMREHLKNAPRLIMEQRRAMLEAESSSESDSESDSSPTTSSSDADSDSSEDSRESGDDSRDRDHDHGYKGRDESRSPPPRQYRDDRELRDKERDRLSGGNRDRYRSRRDSRTPSPSRRRHSDDESRSPPPRKMYDRDRERERAPPPRERDRGYGRDVGDKDRGYEKRRDESREREQEHTDHSVVMAPPNDPPTAHQQRPTMRRKSSAQNLLSSFKPSSSPSPIPSVPPPLNIGMQSPPGAPMSLSSATGTSFMTAATPTAYTPTAKEWDGQSMHSDSTTGPGLGGAGSPAFAQGASVEYLRDLVQKRIITLTYMRNVHDGRSHWFHTIMMPRAELDRVFSNAAMKKRTSRFTVLSMSLSTLFDIHQPQDLLRGLLNMITEYEQAKEENEKPKMRLFNRKMPKRQAGGITDYSMPLPDTSETSYLINPHTPFPLDYHQTLLSLLDILSELYSKISKFLGPSPFPHASQHMLGPLGLLSPHPGVSYLFTGADAAPVGDGDGLWGVAHGGATNVMNLNSTGTMGTSGGPLASPPPSWTPGLGEMVLKVDGKLKKIISQLLKDLDAFARNGIKDELASLDPLLRNVAIPDSARATYDFEF
ncbi:hypothetical protein EW146_g415 [Bondarzewia mesenterica]|uniref:MI domain-containing protein n=1 Tax=Bondarzewia mesenterica TaxID=1095465 RepID=A0A4V3XGE9_9AGAM|nr:hypothetical protein EW146_g415 [Bondarzewia mesenterica]